jgi:hypothetical protein
VLVKLAPPKGLAQISNMDIEYLRY